MAWFKRLATSLRTDASGVVDVLGDQTTMLTEHMRYAEEAVQSRRTAYALLAAESFRLSSERARAWDDCERLERDLELALNGERRDLARYALRLLLRRQRVVETVERRLLQVGKEQKGLEVVLARQQAALEELRARVQAYLTDREADRLAAAAEPVTDDELELELLRRLKLRDAAGAKDAPRVVRDEGVGDRTSETRVEGKQESA